LSVRAGRAPVAVVAFIGAAVTGACLGFLTLFTTFAAHDDEGYFLVSTKGYLGGAKLYDEIYGQYGPFYFEAISAPFRLLGLEVTNDAGRWVTLVLWVLTALLLGAAVHRLTGSVALAAAVDLLCLRVLAAAPYEPMHPGHLVLLLLAIGVALSVYVLPTRRPAAFALLGATLAAATLSKINVGTLAVAAVVFACVFSSSRSSRLLRGSIGTLYVLTPILLMASKIGDAGYLRSAVHLTYVSHEGYLRYAIHVSLAALALALAARRTAGRDTSAWRDLGHLALGGAVLGSLVTGIVLAQGTSPTALVQHVVIDALDQANVYSDVLRIPSTAIAASLAGVGAAALYAARGIPTGRRFTLISATARIFAGIAIWATVIGPRPLGTSLALVWIAAVPPVTDRSPDPTTRLLLPALAVLQALHAYPVAGSQLRWSALLLVPIGGICVADGLADLRTLSARPLVRRGEAIGLGLLAGLALLAVFAPLHLRWNTYRAGVPLDAHGAHQIRFEPSRAATYESLIEAVRRRCATFVSNPGLASIYLMAQQEPPTYLNLSGWLFAFDDATQQRVVDTVRDVPGLCAIRHPALAAFWASGRAIPQRPLVRFIADDFTAVETHGPFLLEVRRSEQAERRDLPP
jgi:hypothetical protein